MKPSAPFKHPHSNIQTQVDDLAQVASDVDVLYMTRIQVGKEFKLQF
jgi:aspartate carbamoyltransferase catalytic subunit